ncbi:hypothetical protein [Brevibacillus nitrificans]|uniref:hypothetical protein n=1 Tax=Brevibacillus nitrificans TaxID=651560 RepID=UPI00285A5EC9|nr:hypothetical protein [Brevibacillus nitrificans]MDR7316557.1 Tfp pilus assembly protein PilV [Brevibacillus nitrificans]
MNCQAFRKAWLEEDTDSDVISHIETCDDCMAWIEKLMTTDEEVQFLKEVPLPSVNLEERIMQAIYQDAGQGTPPHAATESLQPPIPITSKRRTKGFPSLAWVSAAAVLLIVGLAGYQQLQSSNQEMAASMPQSSAAGAANTEIAINTRTNQAPAAADAQQPATAKMAATTEVAKEQPPATTSASDAVQPKAADAPLAAGKQSVAMVAPQAKTTAPESRSKASDSQPLARNAAEGKPAAKAPANNETVALADNGAKENNAPVAKQEAAPLAESNQTFSAMTALDDTEADQAESAKALVGPPAPAVQKAAITLSTFSDLETAVQASDLPVPVLASASGFAVNDVSVQYESETSQKVTRLTADYKRNNSWIKIDVVRNTHGKRSLSIPGTFSATQLFTVGGEQAIGVSFDQQGTKATTIQHAVHFNAQADNQSLYVVISANGVSLNELIETTKELTWE